MQISQKHHAIERKNSDTCVVTEYAIDDASINCAMVKISGRYPAQNCAVNMKCKEMVYVIEGNGRVVVDNNASTLNAGDVVLIEPGEKFYWEGDMSLIATCNPAWTMDQHQLVE